MALLAIAATAAAGCGGGEEEKSQGITLVRPATPSTAQCKVGAARAKGRAPRAPKAGTYAYETRGKRVLISDKYESTPLAPQTETVITQARREDGSICFASQRRYARDFGDTATLVAAGQSVYLTQLRFQVGGYIKTVVPKPPALVASRSKLDWSGRFRGRTSGTYRGEIVGRKRMRVGGKSVRAVGVVTRTTYRGEIKGSQLSTTWFSPKDNLVVAETVTQQRTFGLDRLRLTYKSRLKSLKPAG